MVADPAFFGLDINTQTAPDAITFTQDPDFSPNDSLEDFGWTSGIPPVGSGGKYRIQYEADVSSNVGNVNQDKNFNCSVIIDEPPTFTDAGTSAITAGTKLASPLIIGGTTGYPKSISVSATGTLPMGLSQSIKAGGKSFGAQIRGYPKTATPGDYPITVTGNNGLTSSEENVLVVRAPTVTPAETTTSLSTEASDVPYNVSTQTYTATGDRRRIADRLRPVLHRQRHHDRSPGRRPGDLFHAGHARHQQLHGHGHLYR